jgi:hypothetical protein
VIATSALFTAVKKGAPWAVCFYLKSRCGWRDFRDPANVTMTVAMQAWEQERERQRELTALLTLDEKRIYVALLERAAARQKRQGEATVMVQPRAGQAGEEPE